MLEPAVIQLSFAALWVFLWCILQMFNLSVPVPIQPGFVKTKASNHIPMDAAFLLTIGSFLLTVELFYLQLTILAFLLAILLLYLQF